MRDAVFPEKFQGVNENDVKGSLQTIGQYIDYMIERLDFSITNMTKTVQSAGVSPVEVIERLEEVETTARSAASRASTANARATSALTSITNMQVLSGTVPPTTGTAGNLGQLYIDTVGSAAYICCSETGNRWRQITG